MFTVSSAGFPLIFPAYAGVNPLFNVGGKDRFNLPRVCGGEPAELNSYVVMNESSPRMRG